MVEIADVESAARAGVAVVRVMLRDEIYDVDAAWDDVERKIESARAEFPDAVLQPQFDRDIWDQESIVLAVTGSENPVELRSAALELRRRLLSVSDVSRIIVTADPGEEIRVELREAAARAYGIDLRMLAAALGARNQTIPGGNIEAGGRTIVLSPQSEFESIQEALCCASLSQLNIVANTEFRQISEEKFALMLELIPELHHYCSAISEWNSDIGANGSDQDEGLEFIRRALSVKPTYRLETQ